MKRVLAAAILSVAVCAGLATGAAAQTDMLPRNDKILIDYQDPLDPDLFGVDPAATDEASKKINAAHKSFTELVGRLRSRKVLERFAQFLVPLKLPTTLRLISKQCNESNAFFNPRDNSITICYEYVAAFENNAPRTTTEEGVTRDDAIVGALVSTLLHETGHAIFHNFKVPLLGREEDAADQIAAYVALQFDDKVALTIVRGALWKWRNWGIPITRESTSFTHQGLLADSHSTAQQRFNTFLCIAYGGKPKLFQQFVDAGFIPPARATLCGRDYARVERAFVRTILPNVDPNLMAKVQSATWFYPQDEGLVPVQTR